MLIDLTLDIEKGTNRFSTLDNPITLRQQDAEAYESIIAPAIGTDTVLDGLTQEDYDYAFGKVFGQ